MSYQVLALKWRPKLFKDAVGQDHITKTLKNSIINNKIGHAYLLTGTRGIGKTTVARIFAKAIRCENRAADGEPCLTCQSCLSIDSAQSLDYLEIDGASNNSVDDIRELIENVQYLPTSGQYKVYIIDEVHMLTVNAFNALLKTLEEPPKHVIFIFATTDPQKLLGTVLSRCLRFDFKNASEQELIDHVKMVAKSENLTFENDNVPKELARQARGSFRDALSLFDQVISLSTSSHITEETLYMSLGMADSKSVIKMLTAILLKDKNKVKQIFNQIIQDNIDFKNFSMQILSKLYDIICSVNEDQQVEDEEFQLEVLTKVSLTELMWIYESLFKDLDWSFKTFEPQKATSFVFMKTALREMILLQNNTALDLKKKESKESKLDEIKEELVAPEPILIPKVKVEVSTPTQIQTSENVAQEEKTWTNFQTYLFDKDRIVGVNLERGNMLNPDDFGKKDCVYEIGFKEECKIFYDYLIDGNNAFRLKQQVCDYLGFELDDVEINIKVVDEGSNLVSCVDIVKQNEADKEEELKQSLLNNKYIKNAQQLFSAEINKVVLNKNE